MLFTSIVFAVLLAVTVAGYWAVRSQPARLALLLVSSLLFYGWHHWPSIFLLLASIAVNYSSALWQMHRRSKLRLAAIVAFNLAALGWFKYAAFAAHNLQQLGKALGFALATPRIAAWLPLGISFFTFQVIAYQVDVYRGEVAAERSLLRFSVFKCFFPQLIAGPIVRAANFLPQLVSRRRFDAAGFHHGLFLVVAGMTLKLGVADVLAQFANQAFANPAVLSTTAAWTSLYAFAFQLLSDFWGYSTMAVGMALLFGLELPVNFRLPYLSASLQEFWRRWHITLSQWFRDYVYIPLGGNRSRATRNLLITMGLAGLWHGAGWNFLAWGLVNGVWLAVEHRLKTPAHPERSRGTSGITGWRRALRILLVFHGVCLCWVLFRAPDLRTASAYYARLLLPPYRASEVPSLLATWLIGFAALHPVLSQWMEPRRFPGLRMGWQIAIAVGMILFTLAHLGARIDFIYFTF
jgi:D-alanyl-lipoteichoic acid acyltransferase DltB (MBOAT superfamily)